MNCLVPVEVPTALDFLATVAFQRELVDWPGLSQLSYGHASCMGQDCLYVSLVYKHPYGEVDLAKSKE